MIRRAAVLAALAMSAALEAQQPQHSSAVKVAVRVVDSSNAAVPAAEVLVMRGVSDVVARGVTGDAGQIMLTAPRQDGVLQLSVRKIGFQRGFRFFSLPTGDSMSLAIGLARTVVTLAPVAVTASEDLRRKSYHLDADDIEKSGRAIMDGADIFKLRPDMKNSRGGAPACMVPRTPRTGWIESVWVNGKRVTLAIVDADYVRSRMASLGIAQPMRRPDPRLNSRSIGAGGSTLLPIDAHLDTVISILRDIHPEHIAEVTYHDCFDMSAGKNNSDLAMFIALKPGIGYNPKMGSYVIPADTAHVAALNLDSLPRHRFRVLGIYDGTSGDPLEGVDVIDARSGDRVRSTPTGTVSLFFLPEGTSEIQLKHAGYRDTLFTVKISPSDTTPITAVLTRKPEDP